MGIRSTEPLPLWCSLTGMISFAGHLGNCRMYYLSENYLQYITPDYSLAYLAHSQGKFRFPGIRK